MLGELPGERARVGRRGRRRPRRGGRARRSALLNSSTLPRARLQTAARRSQPIPRFPVDDGAGLTGHRCGYQFVAQPVPVPSDSTDSQ
jgi:hypothetical protein